MNQEFAREILSAVSQKLRGDFEAIRGTQYNPNVKGYDYEAIVEHFLASYLSGLFEFHQRCSLLDSRLDICKRFNPRENEWDIVATFRHAAPRIVLERGGTAWVPYDAVAFLVAVKQTLTPQALEKDLERYERLACVHFTEFGPTISSEFSVQRPLKILFYYEGSITQTIVETLSRRNNGWDILVSFKEDAILANKCIPLAEKQTLPQKPLFANIGYSLPILLMFISVSVPMPLRRTSANLIFNLLKVAHS